MYCITRKIDELGRIVLPIELRKNLNINEKDDVDIFVEEGKVVLIKSINSCFFCNSTDNLKELNKKFICDKCIANLS